MNILTAEQEQLMSVIRDEWIKVAFDTSPVDKEKAEAAINLAYEVEEEKRPKRIIWFDNPLDAVSWMLDNLSEIRGSSHVSYFLHWDDELIDNLFHNIDKRIANGIEHKFENNFNKIIHRKYLNWASESFLANFLNTHLNHYFDWWG